MNESGMIPNRDSNMFVTPSTLDVITHRKSLSIGIIIAFFIATGISLILGICSFLFLNGVARFILPIILIVGTDLIFRLFIIRERYFKKLWKEAKKNKYQYPYSILTNIVSVSPTFPYIFKFSNGQFGVAVLFDKGEIIGKGNYGQYEHSEALTTAYHYLLSKKIVWTHTDYMTVIGNDTRFTNMLLDFKNCENKDVRRFLSIIFGFVTDVSKSKYAAYDLYVFRSSEFPEKFWSIIQTALGMFKEANFMRQYVLNETELTKVPYNIFGEVGFNLDVVMNSAYSVERVTDSLRVISIEKDGVKRKISKTTSEEKQEREVLEHEKEARKHVKHGNDEDIDLFQ